MNQPRTTTFVCPGIPRPQGSKNVARNGHVYESSKHVKQWREDVSTVAKAAHKGDKITGPVRVDITFFMRRPKRHYKSNGALRETEKHAQHTQTPDIDKLARAIFDALTGVVIADDAQVVAGEHHKVYAKDYKIGSLNGPRVFVQVTELEG